MNSAACSSNVKLQRKGDILKPQHFHGNEIEYISIDTKLNELLTKMVQALP